MGNKNMQNEIEIMKENRKDSGILEENDLSMSKTMRLKEELNKKIDEYENLERNCDKKEKYSKHLEVKLEEVLEKSKKLSSILRNAVLEVRRLK